VVRPMHVTAVRWATWRVDRPAPPLPAGGWSRTDGGRGASRPLRKRVAGACVRVAATAGRLPRDCAGRGRKTAVFDTFSLKAGVSGEKQVLKHPTEPENSVRPAE
jgi:hypothetical protein